LAAVKFRALFADLRHMNKYLIAALAVFITGFVLGIDASDRYGDFIRGQMKGIEQIASSIQGREHPQLWLFLFIFWNNVTKSLMFVYFGLLFGILPIGVLVINGMVLGFVSQHNAAEQTWLFVAKAILPHGIIEIPAILLACAYGIRLGFIVLKSVGALFIPGLGARVRQELSSVLKLTFPLSAVLVVALLIAAIIESTLTYWLVKM
jgi:stage II sporulation protein M